ncbi:MAG: aldo/keto reductase [Caldilineae bacterium]|nr:MAG: aldo/keto reductase [Caldilineae bacterium]
MEYRLFGRTGMRVSPLCLGVMNFGGRSSDEEAEQMFDMALEAGINFFDTADVYNEGRSEQLLGRLVAERRVRDQVIIASKVHFPVGTGPNDRGNSRLHIQQACEASLRRLGVETIDLYQIHRPDFDIDQEETLRALDDLIHAGKVRYIGCSTHPAWLVMEALAISERKGLARYVSEQPPYNLLDRRIENELVPLALRYNLALIPWSPLAGGILAGRYPPGGGIPPDSRAAVASFMAERANERGRQAAVQVAAIARELGMTGSQLALLWIMHQPGITAPIIGPRTPAHLADNLKVLDMQPLDSEILARLDEICPPGTALSNFHNNSGWMKMRID